MRVLLKKDVLNLGHAGDVKNVKTGYARNYLIPQNLVIVANAKSQKEQLFLEQVQKRKMIKRKREAEEKSSDFKDISVELTAKLGSSGKLYGSITNIDIHKALINQGLNIERRMIILDEPIKTLGIFKIRVKLYQGVHTNIQVIVTDEQENASIKDTEESAAVEDIEESAAVEDIEESAAVEDIEESAAVEDIEESAAVEDIEESAAVEDIEESAAVEDIEESAAVEDIEESAAVEEEESKKKMFVFEDIVLLENIAIQKTLRELNSQDLAKALQEVDTEVQEKIFTNMSQRAASLLKEEIDFMKPMRPQDIEESQQKIVNIIYKLEKEDEIVVTRAEKEKSSNVTTESPQEERLSSLPKENEAKE